MERYPRSKQLYMKGGKSEIFSFESLKAYEAKLKEGWVFNPADLNKEKIVEEVKEVEVETILEPRIFRPSVPGTPDIPPIDPLKCKLCDFVGKNTQSLRMHKQKKHKD